MLTQIRNGLPRSTAERVPEAAHAGCRFRTDPEPGREDTAQLALRVTDVLGEVGNPRIAARASHGVDHRARVGVGLRDEHALPNRRLDQCGLRRRVGRVVEPRCQLATRMPPNMAELDDLLCQLLGENAGERKYRSRGQRHGDDVHRGRSCVPGPE